MNDNVSVLPTERAAEPSGRGVELYVRPGTGAGKRSFDAAHEHGSGEMVRIERRDRADVEHGPPELYIG